MDRRPLVVTIAVAVAALPVFSAAAASLGSAGPSQEVAPLPEQLSADVAQAALPSRLEPVQGIGPGSQLSIHRPDGSYGCTANFVFASPDGTRYLGTAGHCILPDNRVGTHGPMADFDASRVRVEVAGGCPVEVYANSCTVVGGPTWWELDEVAYARDGTVSDFAVIEIPEKHHDLIRLEMPEWGGPDGAAQAGEGDDGETVLHYGHGIGTGQAVATRARSGVLIHTVPNGTWWHATTPVAWGDSGSPIVLAADDGPPMTGGPALGIVTHLSIPGAAGPRLGSALTNVLCWARLDLRVLPNGSFLGECPRAGVGTEGAHGTLIAVDAYRDTRPGADHADIERVWIDSDGSNVRFTFRIADLRPDQLRTRYQIHGDLSSQNGPLWSVYCSPGGHGGVLSEPLECNGYPASWDVDRDLIWADIPYSEFGWESGDRVGEVFGRSQVGDPVWVTEDSYEGNGTHTLT